MRAFGTFLCAVLLWVPAMGLAQSLGAVAKKERKRRESNRREGKVARVITESDIRSAPPAPRSGNESTESPVAPDVVAEDVDENASALAPEFTLTDRNGRTVALASLRGKPVLIDFWATWCGPCRATMPEIQRLHRVYGGRLQVIGINIEGKSAEVLDYLNDGQYSFDVLFDEGNFDAPTARRYGVSSIPRTFLIDGEGRIAWSGHPQNLPEETIRSLLP